MRRRLDAAETGRISTEQRFAALFHRFVVSFVVAHFREMKGGVFVSGSQEKPIPAIMAAYLKLTDVLNKIMVVLTGVVLVFMSVAVFGSVTSRFIANFSLAWVEEAATFGIAWVVAFGTAIAVRGGDLTAVEVVAMHLKGKTRHIVKICVCIISMFFFCFVIHSGWRMANIAKMQMSPTIPWLSMFWVYLAMPVGAICMFINMVARLIELVFNRREK